MVEKEKKRNSRSPSPKTHRKSPDKIGHVGVKSYGKYQFMKQDGTASMSEVNFPHIIPNPRDAQLKSRLDNASPGSVDRATAQKLKTFNTVNLDSEAIRNYRPKRNMTKSSKFEYIGTNLNQSFDNNNSLNDSSKSPAGRYPRTEKKNDTKFQ